MRKDSEEQLKKKMAKLWILSLLRCYTASLGEWLAANRKTVIFHCMSKQFLHSLVPEDGVRILRNVGSQSPNDAASLSRIHDPSLRPQ